MTLVWHDEVGSTQDLAHELAEQGAPHGSAVAARRQRAGRGSRGRPWASGDGGLWLSVVGRPAGAPALEVLSLRVGLELAPALEAAAALPAGRLRLKWPNDLVLDDRKLGGILCEARWRGPAPEWVVVGVGLNLANVLDPAIASRSTRLADAGWVAGPEPLAPVAVAAVLRALDAAGPLAPSELAAYRTRDWLLGQRLVGSHAGRVRGVSPAGRLLVEGDDGALTELTDSVGWADLAPSGAGH